MTWQQIELVLADYFRSLGIDRDPEGGETTIELVDDEFLLSDLAKHLERELRAP